MGYSRVFEAPQTGSISTVPLHFRNQKSERELQIKTPNMFLYKEKL
jgi:hypothetical protein